MSAPSNNSNSGQNQQQPGLWEGHAEYIKGVAEARPFPLPSSFSSLLHHHKPSSPLTRFPSALWGSHTQQSAVGAVTGSSAWSASGEQDKAHARASMQAAAEHRDPAKSGYGRAEEVAGRLTGCEGMKHEGAASRAAGTKRRDE